MLIDLCVQSLGSSLSNTSVWDKLSLLCDDLARGELDLARAACIEILLCSVPLEGSDHAVLSRIDRILAQSLCLDIDRWDESWNSLFDVLVGHVQVLFRLAFSECFPVQTLRGYDTFISKYPTCALDSNYPKLIFNTDAVPRTLELDRLTKLIEQFVHLILGMLEGKNLPTNTVFPATTIRFSMVSNLVTFLLSLHKSDSVNLEVESRQWIVARMHKTGLDLLKTMVSLCGHRLQLLSGLIAVFDSMLQYCIDNRELKTLEHAIKVSQELCGCWNPLFNRKCAGTIIKIFMLLVSKRQTDGPIRSVCLEDVDDLVKTKRPKAQSGDSISVPRDLLEACFKLILAMTRQYSPVLWSTKESVCQVSKHLLDLVFEQVASSRNHETYALSLLDLAFTFIIESNDQTLISTLYNVSTMFAAEQGKVYQFVRNRILELDKLARPSRPSVQ